MKNILSPTVFISSIIFFVCCETLKAQNIYSCTNGEVTFFSKAPLEDIQAASKGLNSILNTSNNEIVFIVPMTSFKFKKSMMEEHFNENYIESHKYPNAVYKGKINENIDYSKDGEYEVTSTGTLALHGVDKTRTEKGKMIIKEGKISIHSEFTIAIKEHNIEIPKLVVQNIAEIVKVNFIASYSPYKKQ